MDEVTQILDAVDRGETNAAEKLLPLVYQELKRIAASKMATERAGHTLQPTALVHEAYLRLVGKERSWRSRSHFISAAAEAMRRVLIDRARQRQTTKRGGDPARTTWKDSRFEGPVPDDEVLAVNDALQRLEAERPELAQIVKLRYFAGMRMDEIASMRECSLSTVERSWRVAKAWLLREISDEFQG